MSLFYSKIFREEAVARQARGEPLDERLQVTAAHEWMVLAGLGVALLLLLAWGIFGSVERSHTVKAVLVQPGERHAVLSPVSGNVIEVLAEVGDTVEAGQTLARVRLPETERQARIAGRILNAVQDGMRGDAVAELRTALLTAARNEIEAIEFRAAESIVAQHGGRLVAHRLVPGQPVRTGETVAQVLGSSEDDWQALAFIPAQDAEKLEAGMDAEVWVTLPEQPGASRLEARVLEVSPGTVTTPQWLADLGLATPTPAHLLRLVLNGPSRLPLADGAGGRARIVLGSQSPAALLLANTDI